MDTSEVYGWLTTTVTCKPKEYYKLVQTIGGIDLM